MALTWQDLDDMVEGDPLVLRDRAWEALSAAYRTIAGAEKEIQRLRAELRARPGIQIGHGNTQTNHFG
jgi:hypothetical protein